MFRKSFLCPYMGIHILVHNLAIFVRFRQSRAVKSCIFCQESDANKIFGLYPMFQKKVQHAHIWAYTFWFITRLFLSDLDDRIRCQESDANKFLNPYPVCRKSLMPIYGHTHLMIHNLVNFSTFWRLVLTRDIIPGSTGRVGVDLACPNGPIVSIVGLACSLDP